MRLYQPCHLDSAPIAITIASHSTVCLACGRFHRLRSDGEARPCFEHLPHGAGHLLGVLLPRLQKSWSRHDACNHIALPRPTTSPSSVSKNNTARSRSANSFIIAFALRAGPTITLERGCQRPVRRCSVKHHGANINAAAASGRDVPSQLPRACDHAKSPRAVAGLWRPARARQAGRSAPLRARLVS